jgi:HK97 family phage portal protein
MYGLFTTFAGGIRASAEDGRPNLSPLDDFWYTDLGQGGASAAGVRVTPDIALKASALYACLKLLAETIASVSLQMYRSLVDGGFEEFPNHPLDELIRYQPNDINTAVEFWEFLVFHAGRTGTSYAEIVPGPRGAIDKLLPLHPDRVRAEKLTNGRLRFNVRDEAVGTERVLTQDEVFRIPGLSADGYRGLRLVDYAADAIGLGMAADQYAGRVFSNNLNIGVILHHPTKLSEEGQKNLIDAFMAKVAGAARAHRPVVLQEGMKAEKFGQTATEAQLIEARKWQIGEVARFLRIPLHMLGLDDQTNRSTVEEQSINFVKYTLRPWCKRIEQAIRRDLITATQFSAKFDLDSLMRGNAQAQGEYWAKALGSGGTRGWLTQNEVRKKIGERPLPGGDDLPQATNAPVTGSENQPTKRKPPANDDDENARKPTDNVLVAATLLVSKEVVALRKAAMKHADDAAAFRTFAGHLYRSQVAHVMTAMQIDKKQSRIRCLALADRIGAANDIALALDELETNGAAELATFAVQHPRQEKVQ